jgi:hypothetical protein
MRSDRLKALNTPRRIDVECDAEGMPTAVWRSGGQAVAGPTLRPTARPPDRLTVVGIGDTWRIDDEWWRQPIARRYVEVMLERGGRMVVFEDLVTGEWFVQ